MLLTPGWTPLAHTPFLWGDGDRCVCVGTVPPTGQPARLWACGLAVQVQPQSAGPRGTCHSKADAGSLAGEQNRAAWVGPCADKERALSRSVVTDWRGVRTQEGAVEARCDVVQRHRGHIGCMGERPHRNSGSWERQPLKWHLRVVLHVRPNHVKISGRAKNTEGGTWWHRPESGSEYCYLRHLMGEAGE